LGTPALDPVIWGSAARQCRRVTLHFESNRLHIRYLVHRPH